MRRIGVFTASRADLGPLGPVIEELDAREDVDLVVLASGTHTNAAMGGRLQDIPLQRGRLVVLDVGLVDTTPEALGHAFGAIAEKVSDALLHERIELLVVLGDRWELLAVAGAALLHGVPIAHLHGGETTEGAIDERIRHSITKLADLHLCATVDSAARLRALGEESWRITVTGAPGLDRVRRTTRPTQAELEAIVGGVVRRPLAVLVYHPGTVDRTDPGKRVRQLIEATAAACGSVVALHPGADPGAAEVVRELETAAGEGRVTLVTNLGDRYLPLLSAADVLVGNSSSGIIEAASLGLPVVDVGDRQRGRLRAPNVLHVEDDDPDALERAIVHALSHEHRSRLEGLENPYGDGAAAPRIVEALLEAPQHALARKPLVEARPAWEDVTRLLVRRGTTLRECLRVIDRSGLQVALLVDTDRRLLGTVSDGDVRRALLDGADLEQKVEDVACRTPVSVSADADLHEVLETMSRTGASVLPVLDDEGVLVTVHALKAVVPQALQALAESE